MCAHTNFAVTKCEHKPESDLAASVHKVQAVSSAYHISAGPHIRLLSSTSSNYVTLRHQLIHLPGWVRNLQHVRWCSGRLPRQATPSEHTHIIFLKTLHIHSPRLMNLVILTKNMLCYYVIVLESQIHAVVSGLPGCSAV